MRAENTRPRNVVNFKRVSLVLALGLAALLIGVPGAWAYESYHAPTTEGQGYCAGCHPGFVGGPASPLHALHTGGSDNLTFNCNLCHLPLGIRNNPLIMYSAGDNSDGLGCMGCHGRDYGESIGANWQNFPILGNPKSSGYGLRKHHQNSGITICAACHGDPPRASSRPRASTRSTTPARTSASAARPWMRA